MKVPAYRNLSHWVFLLILSEFCLNSIIAKADLGLTSSDVGTVGVAGSSTYDPSTETYTVFGAGTGIGSISDRFHYVSTNWTGNVEMIARVKNLQNTDPLAKAGIMIRESLASNSKFTLSTLTSTSGLQFQYRSVTAGGTGTTSGGAGSTPVWLRLVRIGDLFISFSSTDGLIWNKISSKTVMMSEVAFVGLAVTSRKNSILAQAQFDQVDIRSLPDVPAPWLIDDVGLVGISADASFEDDTFSVATEGNGFRTSDSFGFIHQTLSGDGQVIGRIIDVENTTGSASAGIMIREDLTLNSRFAMVSLTPANQIGFTSRAQIGKRPTLINSFDRNPPVWIKLIRWGNDFRSFHSFDGLQWTAIGNAIINMPTDTQVGLASTSKRKNVLGLSTFDHVMVLPGFSNDTQDPLPPTSLLLASKSDTWIRICWDPALDDVGVVSYEVYRDGINIGTTSDLIFTDPILEPNTTYIYVIRSVDLSGKSSIDSEILTITTDASTLPLPWKHRDVGQTIIPGLASASNTTFHILYSGAPIGGASDSFHFVYQSLPGDGEISANIIQQSQTNSGAKVGLMIRESLTTNSPSIFFGLNSTNALVLQNRKILNGSTSTITSKPFSAPIWLRVSRSGSTFSAYHSSDGSTWNLLGKSVSNLMSTNAFVGLALTSYKKTLLNQALVESVQVIGGEQPPSGDNDLDGLDDAWELTHFGNLTQGANDDFDGDGLKNGEEFTLGTDPTLTDTDGDTVSDHIEILQGRSPTKGAVADTLRLVKLDLFSPLE
jgi:regulation of enolase protein 1 (concanavalin A-like superfamily)